MKLSSLSPKRLFRSNKPCSAVSRSDPPSFSSSASSSDDSLGKPAGPSASPTSMLPCDNVSRTQLEALLKRLVGSSQEVALMLSEVDCDENGRIPLEALLHQFSEPAAAADDSDQLLREAFDVFDTDHDGKIIAEELFSVLTAIGDDRCTLEECRRMIAGVDINGDGFVCFQDFGVMMDQRI